MSWPLSTVFLTPQPKTKTSETDEVRDIYDDYSYSPRSSWPGIIDEGSIDR